MANQKLSIKVGVKFPEIEELTKQAESLLKTASKDLSLKLDNITVSDVKKVKTNVQKQVDEATKGVEAGVKLKIDSESLKGSEKEINKILNQFLKETTIGMKTKGGLDIKEQLLGSIMNDFKGMENVLENVEKQIVETFNRDEIRQQKKEAKELSEIYKGMADYLRNTKVSASSAGIDADVLEQIKKNFGKTGFLKFDDRSRISISSLESEISKNAPFKGFINEEDLKSQENLLLKLGDLYQQYLFYKNGGFDNKSLISDEEMAYQSSTLTTEAYKTLVENLKRIQEANANLKKEVKDVRKNVAEPSSVKDIGEINEAFEKEISLLKKKAREIEALTGGKNNKIEVITNKYGQVSGGLITTEYENGIKVVEKFGLVSKEVEGEQITILDKISNKLIDNKEKMEKLTTSNEKYLLGQENKLKNLISNLESKGSANPKFDSSQFIKEAKVMLETLDKVKKSGEIVSQTERNTFALTFNDLKRLANEKEKIANQNLSDSKKEEAILKANLKLLDAQVDKINKTKSSATVAGEKDKGFDTDFAYKEAERLLRDINLAKEKGVELSLKEQLEISKSVNNYKIQISEIIKLQSIKTKSEKDFANELSKTEKFISAQSIAIDKLLSKTRKADNKGYDTGGIKGEADAMISILNEYASKNKSISENEKIAIKEQIELLKILTQEKIDSSKIEEAINKKNKSDIEATIRFASSKIEILTRLKSNALLDNGKNGYDASGDVARINDMLERLNATKREGIKLDSQSKQEIISTVNAINIKYTESKRKAKEVYDEEQKRVRNLNQVDTFYNEQIRKLERIKRLAEQKDGDKTSQRGVVSEIDREIAKYNELKATTTMVEHTQREEAKKTLEALKVKTNELTRGTSALARVFGEVGSYFLQGSAIYTGIAQLRTAVTVVKELDTAFTDLAITMNISQSKFGAFASQIQGVAKDMGTTVNQVMDVARVYANAKTSVDEIMQKVQPSIALANVSKMSGGDVTKTVQSTINQFKMLEDSSLSVEDATLKIGNALVAVSKNMAFDFSAGVREMVEAIETAGSVAYSSGQSLESYIATMGATIESTGKSGSEIANAYKMIASRVLQIKELSNELGITDIEMAKAEENLSQYNIAIREGNGKLRDLDAILQDVAKQWATMTDEEKQANAEALAGTRNRATYISIIEAMGNAQTYYQEAMSGTNALMEAQDKYANSLEGKLGSLKASYQTFLSTLVEGGALKGAVDGLTSVVGVVNKLAETFGGLPVIIVSTFTALTVFNSKFNTAIGEKSIFGLSRMTKGFTNLRVSIKEATTVTEVWQAVSAKLSLTNAQNILSTNGLSMATIKLKLAQMSATVATYALQTALTMGLGVVITAVMGIVTKFADSIITTTAELKEFNREVSANMQDTVGIVSSAEKGLKRIKEIEREMNETGDAERKKELNAELIELQKTMATTLEGTATGFTAEGEAIATNNGLIEAQIEHKKNLALLDAMEFAKKNKDLAEYARNYKAEMQVLKDMEDGSGFHRDANGNTYKTNLDAIRKQQEMLQEMKTVASEGVLIFESLKKLGFGESQLIDMGFPIRDIQAFNSELYNTKKAVEDVKNAGKGDAGADAKISEKEAKFKSLSTTLQQLGMSAKDANERIKEIGDLSPENQAQEVVKSATTLYGEAVSKAEELHKILKEVNDEQAMTPALISQIAERYPEIGAKINDVTSVQDFLNEKIKEQVSIQQQAYEIMIGDDAEYYNAKIANNNEFSNALNTFLNSFLATGAEAYNIDLSNYQTLNELKNDIQNQFGDSINQWLSQYVDVNADGYGVDLRNFRTLAELKAQILAQLMNEIAKVNRAIATTQANINSAVNTINSVNGANDADGLRAEKSYDRNTEQLNNLNNMLNNLNGAVEQVNTNFGNLGNSGFGGFNGGGISGGGSVGGGSVGGGSVGNKKDEEAEYQRERERMEREANSAIMTLRNALVDALKKKYEALRKAELEPLDKELEMKRKELERLRNGNMDDEEQLKAMKEQLELWKNNDSAYAQQKASELEQAIKEKQLEMDIDRIEKEKEAVNKKYDDMTEDKKLYDEANKLITENNQKEMLDLLETYGKDYADMGYLLGKSFTDKFKEQMDEAKKALDYLKGVTDSYNPKPDTGGGSSGGGSSSGNSFQPSSGKGTVNSTATVYQSATSTDWYGEVYQGGELTIHGSQGGRTKVSYVKFDGGSKTGWIDTSKLKRYDTGGLTGDWSGSEGKVAMLHKKERVLSAEQTQSFERLVYDILPTLANIPMSNLRADLAKLENGNGNSKIEFNNVYNVTNNTPFDEKMFENNIEKKIRDDLRRVGVRTR